MDIPSELLIAAESGDLIAQRKLGMRFCEGHGVRKDLREAAKWWTKAAETNDAWAQYHLGYLALKRKDMVEAEKWWRKAAESGEPTAQYGLAFSFNGIIGVDEQLNWLRKSANSGYSEAQKFLGFLTFWGSGVDRDRVAGMKWMILGVEGSKKLVWLIKLEVRVMKWFMTRDEVFRAHQQVRLWKENKSKSSVIKL